MKNLSLILMIILLTAACSNAQNPSRDEKVAAFLQKQQGKWRDMNVPYEDGKTLYDLIVKNKYQSALEIGTSTGHSTVWIAWAMSKTGGKVITLEIDERRQKEALKNIREAGLTEYVDARLGDAHHIVKELKGTFDFVFSDADKDWYKQYFIDLDPKIKQGGCYTTHNVTDGLAGEDYLNFVKTQPKYKSTIDRSSRAGIMISYKQKD